MTKEIARPLLSALSAVLKMAREERGMSQMEVARRSGLHRTYVCEVERGTRKPSLHSVIQIAAALDVPVSDLVKRAEQNMRGEDAHRNGEGH
jgi:transcriptional regulator with XRE-family HTH domain